MKLQLSHLAAAHDRDFKALETFREKRNELIRLYVGSNYSDNGSSQPQPLNLFSLYVRTMIGQLMGGEPQMMVSTFNPKIRPFASIFEPHANRQLRKMRFGETMRKISTNSLFLMGIGRIAITAPAEARFGGYVKESGKVSIQDVDFDDFCFDTRPKNSYLECGYMSYRYFLRYEDVKNSGLFDKKARKAITPIDPPIYNKDGNERTSAISRQLDTNVDEFEELVEIRETYLPRVRKVVTYDAEMSSDRPLLVQDWVGPPCGPFIICHLMDVPGQLIGKAPLMDLKELHNSSNVLWMKQDNAASNVKDVIAYLNSEDAEKHKSTAQNSYVQMSSVDAIRNVRTGGVSGEVAVQHTTGLSLFNELAGNLRTLGGLASQAGTARQEEILRSGSSVLVNHMSLRLTQFAEECMRSLGYFYWTNPYEDLEAEYHPDGLPEFTITRRVSPEARAHIPFHELDLQINPYSLAYQTPQQKIQIIDKMMREVFIPALPLFQNPGVSDFMQAYVKMKAKFENVPELVELMEKLVGIQTEGDTTQGSHERTLPSQTTRIQERVSSPGMTDAGRDFQKMQLAMGQEEPEAGGY